MEAKEGNKVKVEYEGTLKDGKVFDSSEKHGQPLEFTLGEGKLLKKFEAAVIGMKEGEKKDIQIPAKEAYGQRNDQLIQEVPRDKMPEGDIKPGVMLGMMLPDGRQAPATVTKVTKDSVTVDLNHPLAGQDIKFHIKLVKIGA